MREQVEASRECSFPTCSIREFSRKISCLYTPPYLSHRKLSKATGQLPRQLHWPNSLQYDKKSLPLMSLRVARGVYNPEKERFHYYVSFKPTLDPTAAERGVEGSHSVEVAISVTEIGELADLAFTLPEPCRSRRSLEYLNRTHSATLVDEKVFITVPGLNGDSVLQGKGTLELDAAGRIMGLEIN